MDKWKYEWWQKERISPLEWMNEQRKQRGSLQLNEGSEWEGSGVLGSQTRAGAPSTHLHVVH